MITPAKSCNWKGFIDIKASQWKIGGYTGQGEEEGANGVSYIFKL